MSKNIPIEEVVNPRFLSAVVRNPELKKTADNPNQDAFLHIYTGVIGLDFQASNLHREKVFSYVP